MTTRNGGCRSLISVCPISTRHQHCQSYGWDRTMNSWTWMLQRGMELFSTRYRQVSLIHLIYVSFHFNISLLLYYLIILHEISQSLLIIFYHFLFRSILPLFLIFFVTSRLEILISPPGYYRVNYDKENWKLLNDYLNSNNYTKLSPITRAQLIDDALNLARVGLLPYDVALNLTLYLRREVDYIPWQTTFRNLNFLNTMMRTSDHYQMFNVRVCEIYCCTSYR